MLKEQELRFESARARLAVGLATSHAEIVEAQRLRHVVFAEELGARLSGPAPGVDEDRFDRFCDHLVVRDRETGEIIGTYRILSPQRAETAGGYYSEQEFDLARLAHLRTGLVEVGRSCVHPEHRTGGVIALLWSGLARYMLVGGYTHLIGCASLSMADGGRTAANLYRQISRCHLSPREYRVFPRCPLPVDGLGDANVPELPPLVKGYLRLGAYVCGAPAWDPDFNTADLPIMLPMARIDAKYARHFLGARAAEPQA